jgi:2-octaprenyl-6-methoxyphenol hydroxylase
MSLKQLLGRQVPDCAIIGGGPVGLIFAILSRTSIGNVQIFESKEHDSTNQDNRALALSNGSRLILEEIGVWDRLEKKITKIKKIHTSQAGSFGRTMLDAAEYNEESLGYIISYGDLMGVLQEEVECIRNVKISYEQRLLNVWTKEAFIEPYIANQQ